MRWARIRPGLVLGVALAGAAGCAPTYSERVLIGGREVQSLRDSPTPRLYPKAALDARVEGLAVADCAVDAKNLTYDCRIHSESPEGWGFGEAAVAMASRVRIAAPDYDRMRSPRARVPIRFRLPPTIKPDA